MIVYFADRNQNVMGQASTSLPFGLIIVDDNKTEDIETGVASFDLTINYEAKDRLNLEQMTEAGNYVFRSSGKDAECYTIIDAETDAKAKERHLYCEDAGLDLLNIICGEFEADSAHNIAWYIEQFAGSSGFEVGTNEISELTRTLSWSGEATGTERLRSVATQFDNAEISYRFVIENMKITHRYIDIWQKRGVNINQQLRLDRDIDNVVVKRSVANLTTAVKATGATLDGEDEPLDLIGAPAYDDDDIYLDTATGILYSRNGRARWARPNGGYILSNWSYETGSQSELKNKAISHLRQYSDVEVNYDIDIVRGLENTQIGDRVNIVDDAGEVYVSGRILKLETSVTGNSKKATLGEYLIKTSGLSERVEALATEFANMAKGRTFYTWIAYADDDQGHGISLSPYNKAYMGIAVNQTTETPDITDPSVYSWVAIEGGSVLALSLEITSSAGQVFITTKVATTLTAHVYLNGEELTAQQIADIGTVRWYDYGDYTTVLGTGLTYTITEAMNIDAANITARLEVD